MAIYDNNIISLIWLIIIYDIWKIIQIFETTNQNPINSPQITIFIYPEKSPWISHGQFPMAAIRTWHDQENAGVLISMDELGFTHFM